MPGPLDLATLRVRSGCSMARLQRLVGELEILGLVSPTPSIDDAEARRAYHDAARRVHPDLHPHADDTQRAALTDEMARLAARRRRGPDGGD